ncbi:MAG: septum formation initiator family protein [Bacteroidales bacterium]|nr:septum formation initiator family protein [Bacteroidales bacterium]
MKFLQKIFPIIRKIVFNKYFLAVAIFTIVIVFFGEHSLKNRWETGRNIKTLKKEIRFYEEEIESNKQKMNDMQTGDESLERYAREKYYLKKDSEDIFIIKEDE